MKMQKAKKGSQTEGGKAKGADGLGAGWWLPRTPPIKLVEIDVNLF